LPVTGFAPVNSRIGKNGIKIYPPPPFHYLSAKIFLWPRLRRLNTETGQCRHIFSEVEPRSTPGTLLRPLATIIGDG